MTRIRCPQSMTNFYQTGKIIEPQGHIETFRVALLEFMCLGRIKAYHLKIIICLHFYCVKNDIIQPYSKK